MISNHAIIDPSAKLAEGVTVGPGAIIGAGVEIGMNTWIGPHVLIEGPTKIGKNNKIYQFASIGDAPQDLTYQGEPTQLEIGDNNIIREYCMISRGTVKGGGLTRIGNDNFFMAYVHVGHDCMLGNSIIMANYSALSGHVVVEDFVNFSGYAAIHQFCTVGAHSFISRATYINKDVLPYVMVAGYSAATYGINTVGLRRRGFSSEAIDCLRRAYKIIFRKNLKVQEALCELEPLQSAFPELIPMIDMLNRSTRGIVR